MTKSKDDTSSMQTSSPVSRELVVRNRHGLHLRPMQVFARRAGEFVSSVTIEKDGQTFNGKSIYDLIQLAEMSLHEPLRSEFSFLVHCAGADAEEALQALDELVRNNFGIET